MIGFIKKAGHNKFLNYDYVTDADVLDTVRRELAAHGIATQVDIDSYEHVPYRTVNDKPEFLTTITGKLSFHDAESGEIWKTNFIGTGSDSGDKGYYKAVTGGLKYALLKNLLIPTGDDPERDEPSPRSTEKVGASANPLTGGTKRTTATNGVTTSGVGLTNDQRALLISEYRRHGLAGEQMRWANYQITHKMSTTQMTNEDMDKLMGVLTNGGDEAMLEAAKAVDPRKPEEKE